MRKFILLLLLIFPVFTFAQKQFLIIGKIKNIQAPAKVYLSYRRDSEQKSHWDSTVVKNGEFEFKGSIPDTVLATIFIDYKGINLDDIWKRSDVDLKRIYLSSGITYLKGNDSVQYARLSGAKINADYYKYEGLVKAATSTSERIAIDKKFIKDNPDSYISLDQALKNVDAIVFNVAESDQLFQSLSVDVRTSSSAIAYLQYLNSRKSVMIGAIAPEFALPDTNGNVLKLSALRGKYVLVDFWASWCHPCRAQNPDLIKVFHQYKNRNFTILGVSLDRPGAKDAWINAIHHDGLTWYQVADLQGWNNAAALLYVIKAIPQNFLIDPNGKIVAENLSGDDLKNKLAEILGKK